jgi:hypothetical protein
MNNDPQDKPPTNPPLSDITRDAVNGLSGAVKDVAHQASDAAKSCCTTMTENIEGSVDRAQDCMKRNPLVIVLGAVAVGMAMGCVVALSRHHRPTLRERFVDDPVQTTRDSLYAALAPVAQRLHDSYDNARDGAGRVMNGLHCSRHSWANQLGRVGNHLKFW